MSRLRQLKDRLAPLRADLLNHPIYQEIDRLESLRVFMQHHVFAVWDFMSLLKALQRQLCCVEVPWLPNADPIACRLVNEIVLGEESDDNGHGGFDSHFGLYRLAMTRCGADTKSIDTFVASLRAGKTVAAALDSRQVPECARKFVRRTFSVIESGSLCAIASAFTFGREDLLPEVFQRIVDKLNTEAAGGLGVFKYYLERHIALDGGEHGPMAHKIVSSLCGTDEVRWQQAEQAAVDCLESRCALWDGMLTEIRRSRS